MRRDAEEAYAPGGDAYAGEEEVRAILEFLGMLPVRDGAGPEAGDGAGGGGGPEGGKGPDGPEGRQMLADALKLFQGELGIAASGELDARTAGLLRNSVFRHSMEPLLNGEGGRGREPASGAGESVPGEDDPEDFLDPVLYERPSGGPAEPGAVLSEKGSRWCRRQLVRADVLLRFAPGGEGSGPGLAAFARMEKWCPGSSEVWTGPGELLRPSPKLGVAEVAEALKEAKAWNPELAMDGRDSAALSPGSRDAVGPEEARAILVSLGYAPGGTAGGGGPGSGALRAFQRDVGIPDRGELDARTGGLLRNASFRHCLEPFGGE
jgi:hypothetical protein